MIPQICPYVPGIILVCKFLHVLGLTRGSDLKNTKLFYSCDRICDIVVGIYKKIEGKPTKTQWCLGWGVVGGGRGGAPRCICLCVPLSFLCFPTKMSKSRHVFVICF